jgi:hypothetical protein
MKKNDYNTVVSAAVSGFVNWSVSYPIDVIRTRQISNNKNTLRETINMGSLWKGYTACASRGALTAVVGFLVYENMLKLFK